jgi:hypothetical protein
MEDPNLPVPAVTDETPNKIIRQEAGSCKSYKKKLIRKWDKAVSYRKGLPYTTQIDEDRIAIPLDWSYTKMKEASLFSQLPPVRVNHPPQTTSKEVLPWLHSFEQRINDTLAQCGAEPTMHEVLPDCINAAGIGLAMAYHEALTEDVEVPAIDLATLPPEVQQQITQTGLMPDGSPVPMETVPRVIDKRYKVCRISPSDFLWPLSFTGSNFDDAPWIGRSGQIPWAVAQRRWKLDPALKDNYVGITKPSEERINNDTDRNAEASQQDMVSFDEFFYKEESYNPNVRNFAAIHHLIFISGQDKPVVDEPWKGQEVDQTDPSNPQLIGVMRYPIRTLTLTYITDEAIPPSDSEISRPMSDELNKSRTQMMLQRQHSFPIRAFDPNRIDQAVQINLMRGTYQGMIPVQGNGQTAITEISRSSFPQENFTFDSIIKADASMAWQVGQEPLGNDVETKGEANVIQTNFQTRISMERAKVGDFFCSIAEVLGGLISLYEDPASFGQGFTPAISRTLAYSILADSTVLLNSEQRLKKIVDFTNMFAKSGWVDLENVVKEAATLSGLDPATTVRPPQPPPPEDPNISIRISGSEDMMNPLVLAAMIDPAKIPTPQSIEKAKQLIQMAMAMPEQQIPQLGPDGKVLPQAPTPDASAPDRPPVGVGDDNPGYTSMPKVNQRILSRDKGAEHD